MPRKILQIKQNRLSNMEKMFVSADEKSIRRGRRVAPRTEACRPCLVWLQEEPEKPRQGVVLDLNPYGLRVRMLDHFPEGATVLIQMMRDEDFRYPLSKPILTQVVRTVPETAGFTDHGLKVMLMELKRSPEGRPVIIKRPQLRSTQATRMHLVNQIEKERGGRRSGRNRD